MFGNGKFGKGGEILPEPHEGLPDSSRPSGLCPRCGKQSSFFNCQYKSETIPLI